MRKGINLDIILTPVNEDKKDGDVDIKLKIAPNDEIRDISILKGTERLEELAKQGESYFGSESVIKATDWKKFIVSKTGLSEGAANNLSKQMRENAPPLVYWNNGRADKSFYSFDKKSLEDTGNDTADEIFKDVKEEVREEVYSNKYPNPKEYEGDIWASVFPVEGKQFFETKGKDKPVNLLTLLGGKKSAKDDIIDALTVAAEESGIVESPGKLKTMIKQTAQRIMENFANVDLFYIANTDITRYQVGAKKEESLIKKNPEYAGGFSALYVDKVKDYDTQIAGSLESKLKGQIHHLVPLYIGGSHFYRNLLAAPGNARVNAEKYPIEAAKSAHKALHDLIEKQDDVRVRVIEEMEDNTVKKNIVLETLSPGKVKSAINKQVKSLDLLVGTMYANGYVKYEKSSLNLTKIRKESKKN